MTNALECLEFIRDLVLYDGTILCNNVINYIGEYIPVLTDDNIHNAVRDWCKGGDSKEMIQSLHGPINEWDVSRVTDMSELFHHYKGYFNDDISKWDRSNVIDMNHLYVRWATSFNTENAS